MQFSILVFKGGLKTTRRRKGARKSVKVDMRLSIMKPLSAKLITSAYDNLPLESGIVRGGFIEAGFVEALDQDEQAESDEDPFQDLD